jgi:multidrug efflux system outer membrane protein
MNARIALAALALVAGGCKVGPNYEEPQTSTASTYQNGAQPGFSEDPAASAWWSEFRDPRLDDLLKRAVAGNRDVRAATALLREARAFVSEASWGHFPTGGVKADYTRQLLSRATFLEGLSKEERTFGYFTAGFDAAWELDLFGRVRRQQEAAEAEEGVAVATRRDVLQSLLAEVARNYFEYRGARLRLEVAKKNADLQEQTLQLAIARQEGGRGTELEVAGARAEVRSTQALIHPIEAEAAKAKHRLAVLLGLQPQQFSIDSDPPGAADALPDAVAIGKPEDLLRRRPDIRAAERRLAAATARIGVATADLFPRVTIGGTVGPQATTVSGLFQSGAMAYSVTPTISWAIFDLGRVAAQIRAADARAEADLHRYEQTVLLALEETENALVEFGRERARRDALVEAVAASERAASLADVRYQAGAADFLTTLIARRTGLILEMQLSESRTRTRTALVALYKALGGGWEVAGE